MTDASRVGGEPLVVLLVEDNPDHVELVRRSFQQHRVANAIVDVPDGETALDYLLRRGQYADPGRSPRPHVVLLDLRLPRVDGLEILKKVKEHAELRQTPVVILTSSESEKDIAAAYQYRANSYLVKPLDFTKFTQLMQDLGAYWLGWNCCPWSPGNESDEDG
jgi:CheY-like chemotaxis protein